MAITTTTAQLLIVASVYACNDHIGDLLTTDSCNTLVHTKNRLVSLVG